MSVTEGDDRLSIQDKEDKKELEEHMGYKQELYRGLSAFGSFAFGFTEVGIVSSITSLFGYGLITGGMAGGL